MPASPDGYGTLRPRERASAFAAVALVQVGLALVLLRGFHVSMLRPQDIVSRLIQVTLPKVPPPPPPVVRIEPRKQPAHKAAEAAPKAAPAKLGGSPGPVPSHASPSVTPVV